MGRSKKKSQERSKAKKTHDVPEKPQLPPADTQSSSRLMQLPGELRNQIYKHLFSSTRLTYGDRRTGRISSVKMKSALNSLAILRTCRQVHREAATLWPGLVLFNFEDVDALLDRLSPLPAETLSKIRYVRTRGHTLMLLPVGEEYNIYYRLAESLKLLPGLRLDTLTVLAPAHGTIAYDTLDGLINRGNGWKELHFITPNSEMLGFAKVEMFMMDPYWRKPQPSTWESALLKRDSIIGSTKATVTIYRSTQADASGSIINPHTRKLFTQPVPRNQDHPDFGVAADDALLAEKKELLVIAKRGQGADIAEQTEPPFGTNDIREWAYGMTWAEIRRQCIDLHHDDEDFPSSDEDELLLSDEDEESDEDDEDSSSMWKPKDNAQIDSYIHVDDVEWDFIE
ncbi:hypothetical protein BU16DRAFT_609075 [Lophium mytilinum]|uniref:F-box domain-containing protein n=1 Tax=Lophium mytilinum TaxID=390894 RepID=A0A6A6QVU7_9PEZI|nr:hypothetical protein BU16DRAFT_609075 [Lophium mytilinum]